MPIYINDILQTKKPEKDYAKFKNEFLPFLDPTNTNRFIKPVTIKYNPSLIKADPHPFNKGKFIMPNSLAISYTSQILLDDGMVDVRYSKTAPTKLKDGILSWAEGSVDVNRQLTSIDTDFIFFFWMYSNQNVRNNPSAKLHIENKANELNEIAKARRAEATIQARLWNPESSGGVSFDKLYEFARSRPRYDQSVSMDENEVRAFIEQEFAIVKDKAKVDFLEFTKPAEVSIAAYMENEKVISEAIEAGIISQNNLGTSFCWKTAEGKTGEVIFNWKEVKGNDKPSYKFAAWLKLSAPEMLEKIKEAIAEKAIPA